MNKITTKTGDTGKTSLANGQRLDKDELIFEVLGTLDELNSWLGLIISQLPTNFYLEKKYLISWQKNFFLIGAELASAVKCVQKVTLKRVSNENKQQILIEQKKLNQLDQESLKLQKKIKYQGQHFILPGGSTLAAYLDICRTVSRRYERKLVALSKEQPIRSLLLQIANRWSDYLYLLRCYINQELKVKELKSH